MADNGDSSDDEDYIPTKEELETDENAQFFKERAAAAATVVDDGPLSGKRKDNVDAAWESMNSSPSSSSNNNNSNFSTASSGGKSKDKKVQKKIKKTKSILLSIFGSTVSSNLMKKTPSSTSSSSKKSKKSESEFLSKSVRDAVKKALPPKTTTITETKKFAGQLISVNRVVETPALPDPLKGGLDHAMSLIAAPEKITTIKKTSTDWDSYVVQSGMGDDLKKATDDGYLVKKDFLDRVDGRRYEIEKGERERKR